LRLDCFHEGCGEEVDTSFWTMMAAWYLAGGVQPLEETRRIFDAVREATDYFAEGRRELARLSACGVRRGGAAEPGPICPVCCECCVALLVDDGSATCSEHAACEACWLNWAKECEERCVLERRVAAPCLSAGCKERMGFRIWQHLAPQAPELAAMERLLARRRRIMANELFPGPMQVDCPRPACVGLGYLGFDTVMCFICEHVWVPDGNEGEAPTTDAEQVMGLTVKRCPACNEHIEKNGGCDHMTCRCKHEFFWSTLKPYRGGRPA